jgi:hypothetical protein
VTRLRAVPLPVAVLAVVLALLLGSVGTATAGGLTTKAVKKIAKKVVAKQAPSLSVAHAGDSTTLAGADAARYLDRAGQSTDVGGLALVANVEVEAVAPVAITVPAGVGLLHVSGTATFFTGSTAVGLWVNLDTPCTDTSTPGYRLQQDGDTTRQTSLAADMLFPVTPGVHTARLCALAAGPTNVTHRVLVAETVAAGSAG